MLAVRDQRGRGGDFASEGLSTDLNPQVDGSYSRHQLWRFMWDLRFEPDWRRHAELEYAYYDGDQLSRETLERMREVGMAPVVINKIGPAIDSVSGFEILTRTDIRVIPETDEDYDTATAVNVKFKEALRLSMFNDAVSDAFKSAATIGIGWVEIGRNPDPLEYDYFARLVPWREMFWDYRSRSQDIVGDARFLMRRKWFDADMLARYFPGREEAIRNSMYGYAHGWLNEWEDLGIEDAASNLAHTLDQESRFTLEQDEYRQQVRGRVGLYEICYVVPQRIVVMKLRDGRAIEFQPSNPLHRRAVDTQYATLRRGVTNTWRQAFYAGPERLSDRPLATRRPHYVPIVFYRRDSDGAVYGLVRRQRSPQESINARHARILYDLTAQRVFVDSDAVDDHDETAEEIQKVSSYVVLKADRRGEQGVTLVPGTETSAVTYQMLQQSNDDIFGVTGLYPSFQGTSQSSDKSGIAIEREVEQTTQVLGGPVKNYRRGRHSAADLLLRMMLSDLGQYANVPVELDETEEDGSHRRIILNARGAPAGPRTNDVLMARLELALGETPETASYLQQKFAQLAEIVKSLPPELQIVMSDLVVRAAALPDGEEILDRIRSVTGHGPLPKDPAKRQAVLEDAQRQKQLQEFMQQLEMRISQAEAALKETQAAKAQADAEKTAGADTEMTLAQTRLALAEARATIAEMQRGREESSRKETETEAKLLEGAARLKAASNAEKKAEMSEKKDEKGGKKAPKKGS